MFKMFKMFKMLKMLLVSENGFLVVFFEATSTNVIPFFLDKFTSLPPGFLRRLKCWNAKARHLTSLLERGQPA